MPSSRRDHLVETALSLFCRQGFHATGIDAILAEAGVAKMTLYNHFKSKDELILAALRLRDERSRERLMKKVEQAGAPPREKLLALFDALGDEIGDASFRGCAFINASAEFGDRDDPIHTAAAEHKRLTLAYVRGLAEAAGARDAGLLADQLGLLMDGAVVTAQVCSRCDIVRPAREAAMSLIDAAGC